MFDIWHGQVRIGSITAEVLRIVLTLFAQAPAADPPEPSLAPARETLVARTIPASELQRLRTTLKDLEALDLAALLRELGVALHNRDISQWRVLTDVSDELLDAATHAARRRMGAKVFPDAQRAALRAKRRSRRKAS